MADNPISLMPKTKAEARLRGLPRYDDGRGCVMGHTEGRYTASGRCVVCSRNAIGKGKAKNGYKAKSADPLAFNHRGAPLRDFTPEELARDLGTGTVGPVGARH